jgi:hypothetical protein
MPLTALRARRRPAKRDEGGRSVSVYDRFGRASEPRQPRANNMIAFHAGL